MRYSAAASVIVETLGKISSIHFVSFNFSFSLPAKLLIKLAELLGVRLVVECSENLDKTEKFVAIMNHQSCLDIIAMSQLLIMLGDLAPVVRKVVKYVQPFGLAVRTCDGIFLDNRTKHASRKAVDEKIDRLRERKVDNFILFKLMIRMTLLQRNIAIFPEGTRSDKDHLLPFKKGAFHLSVQTSMRILPVVIQKYPFIDHQRQIFDRGTVKVKILDPIAIKAGESVDEFTMRAHELMDNEFRLLNGN